MLERVLQISTAGSASSQGPPDVQAGPLRSIPPCCTPRGLRSGGPVRYRALLVRRPREGRLGTPRVSHPNLPPMPRAYLSISCHAERRSLLKAWNEVSGVGYADPSLHPILAS